MGKGDFPTFLIIGIGRAGTTTLYAALRQHPEVYVSPVKEPRFFVYDGVPEPQPGTLDRDVYENSVTDLGEYLSLFEEVDDETEWGEASTTYLHDARAPSNIQSRIPEAKLIAILRNPIDRAYSHFSLHVRRGQAAIGKFDAAIERGNHADSDSDFWYHYIKPGFYHRHLTRYLEHFNREQIAVYQFENFIQNQEAIIESTYSFLGVDSEFRPDSTAARNQSGKPASTLLNTLLSEKNPVIRWTRDFIPEWVRTLGVKIKNANLTDMPPLSDANRRRLEGVYRDDINRLSEIIEWDPTDWVESEEKIER